MKKYRFSIWIVLVFMCLIGVNSAAAQVVERPPAIVSFTANPGSVSLVEVESGVATITLSWRVVNLTESHRLSVDVLRLNGWEALFDETAILLPADSRQLTISHPLTFRPPTYRLVLQNVADGRVLDQMILVIPYADPCETECNPVISDFRIPTPSVDADSLRLRTAIIPVAWSITNRPPTANPVFEQIMDDGGAVVIELPRESLWIPSMGEGVVAPMSTQGDFVQIRMRLVDLVSGEVYDEMIVGVPVSSPDRPALSPTAVPATARPEASISLFHAIPNPANPSDTVTLTWEVTGADSVLISWLNPDLEMVNNEHQPLSGTMTVAMPGVRTRSGVATFDIWALDAAGEYSERNAGGAVTARVEVMLLTDLHINSFTISPDPVAANGTVTLSWDVSNAASVSITRLSPAGVFQASSVVEGLSAIGSIDLAVPEEYVSAVTYYIGATDANGIMQGQYVTTQISE
jgi:hypothetical protein